MNFELSFVIIPSKNHSWNLKFVCKKCNDWRKNFVQERIIAVLQFRLLLNYRAYVSFSKYQESKLFHGGVNPSAKYSRQKKLGCKIDTRRKKDLFNFFPFAPQLEEIRSESMSRNMVRVRSTDGDEIKKVKLVFQIRCDISSTLLISSISSSFIFS